MIQETAENYESYVKDISDETFKVNVKVNAQVEVPEVDKLSVVRVKQKELDDEFLAKFLSVCEPDTVFTSDRIYNRSECEDNISQIRSQINDVENGNTDISDEEKQTVIEDLQKNIDSWQSIYENAPEEVTAEDVEAKRKIQSWSAWQISCPIILMMISISGNRSLVQADFSMEATVE